MLNIKKFGKRLSYLRKVSQLTQREVAECCHVTMQAVSKWERGLSCPDLLIVDDLARILGVEIKDLFE